MRLYVDLNLITAEEKKTKWSATTLMPTLPLFIDFWFSCEIAALIASHMSCAERAIKQSNYVTNDKIT